MSDEKPDTEARLRRQIADGEAKLDALRARLAKIVAKKEGKKVPVTGIELLWKEALPMARTRSSKHECRTQWNRIPVAERPTIQELINALRIWNKCSEWKKDGGAFVQGLDKWIKNRRWEDLPEIPQAPSRYRAPAPKPIAQPAPGEAVTDISEIAKLLSLKPEKKPSVNPDCYE